MKRIIAGVTFLCLLLTCCTSIYSQPLKQGDQFPDITFDSVLNYKDTRLNFRDLKGKFVVFDFWGFNCSACLRTFSKLEELQKEYNDKMQIVLVNYGGMNETKEFFEKRKRRLSVPNNIPLITSDTLLRKLFPHAGSPHLIFIDETGKVSRLNATLNKEILEGYVSAGTLPKTVDDRVVNVKSLFDKRFEPLVEYATYISRAVDNLKIYIRDGVDYIPEYACSIAELYQFAYNESFIDAWHYGFRNHGRTILNVRDKTKYERRPKGTNNELWRKDNGYYYHAILPERLEKDRFKIMQQELGRYFNLKVSIEMRNVHCLQLIRTSKADKLKTKGGKPALTSFGVDWKFKDDDPLYPPVRFLRNQPFEQLTDWITFLCAYEYEIMFVDGTGYAGNIDFEVSEKDLKDVTVPGLRKILKKYDLDLVEKDLPMDVLVLSEQ